MKERNCIFCKTIILECMGGVIAEDFILATSGQIPFSKIREVCGKCALVKTAYEIPPNE